MKTRRTRRRFHAPSMELLGQRRLLSMTPVYRGQDGYDFVGKDRGPGNAGRSVPNPNDYQDVHIRLEGLNPNKEVEHVYIKKAGGGWDWTWWNTGIGQAAYFVRDPVDDTVGDVYIEPTDQYYADHPLSKTWRPGKLEPPRHGGHREAPEINELIY